ncbi:MAG: hypothetical protein AB1468_02240 [Candidatus Micrarchaeota archaeon]
MFLQREPFLRERPLLEQIRKREQWRDDILHALVVMGMRERGWKMIEEIYGKREKKLISGSETEY